MAKKRTIGRDILIRVRWLYIIFLAAGIAIVGRIAWIQYGPDGDSLRERAEDITFARFRIPAERGDILSRDGRTLATTIPQYEIRMDFGVLNMTRDSFSRVADSLAHRLSGFFGDASQKQYKSLLENNFDDKDNKRFVRINRRKISYTEEKQLAKFPLFRAGRYKSGYIAQQSSLRFLPMGSLARSVVGIMKRNDDEDKYEPLRGLEMSYDSLLRGTDGYTMKQKISGSFWIPVPDEGNMEPVNGYDIVTTIDPDIQDVAERILRQQLQENNGYWGTVILMEVATGGIVAMANLGRMDDGGYGEIFNYAINKPVEPGSTFKLATMLALLEVGGMKITDMVDCRPDPGHGRSAKVGIRYVPDDHVSGVQTLRQTFEQSSNIGFARSALRSFGSDPMRYVAFIRDSLMLGHRTGIDLANERKADIVDPSNKQRWHGTSLIMMSFGYALEITPLTTLTLYNAVANNGRMMRPMLVSEVRSYGETVHRFEPAAIKEAIASPQTIRDAQSALAGVVMEGTGRLVMKGAPYTAVAKTGTAQQVIEGGRGYRAADGGLDILCSFTGYFPIENPKYSCIVAIKAHERPGTKRLYGSNVAGPVFRAVADRIYARAIELHDKSYGPERHPPAQEHLKGGRTDVVKYVTQHLSLPYTINDGGDGWWAGTGPEKTDGEQRRTPERTVVRDAPAGFAADDDVGVSAGFGSVSGAGAGAGFGSVSGTSAGAGSGSGSGLGSGSGAVSGAVGDGGMHANTGSPADSAADGLSADSIVDGEETFPRETAVAPSVVGMGLKDAVFLLEQAGFRVGFSGMGKVAAQSVKPGTACPRGQKIDLTLKL